MDDVYLQKIKEIGSLEELIEFISPFYPNIDIKEYTLDEIETALFDKYFRLIGKIMIYSPQIMRSFLKDFLLKYEVNNIKQIILGTILNQNIKEKSKNVNFLVEEYLENTQFIKDLLKLSSLDEIQLFLKESKYNKAIREGILYFKKNNEVYVLESFLDQLYYKNLIEKNYSFNKREKEMINLFINYKSEIYNLNVIYRGLKNKIDIKILNQFLLDNYLFLNENKINYLLSLENEAELIQELQRYLIKTKELRPIFAKFGINEKHLMISLENIYLTYCFKKFHIKIGDIDNITIYKILEILIKKEYEIKFIILPNVVRLSEQKYRKLKSYIE